jgi:hypothetical protein
MMSVLSSTARIQVIGCGGGALSFWILFFGALATGGGHGHYTLWYVGLAAAALSALLLVIGTASAAWKKTERKSLICGVLALGVFSVVGLRFFDIAEWLGDLLFR